MSRRLDTSAVGTRRDAVGLRQPKLVRFARVLLVGSSPTLLGGTAGASEPAESSTDVAASVSSEEGTAAATGKSDARSSRTTRSAAHSKHEPQPAKDRGETPWIKRWAPERNMIELGAWGGLMFPSRNLELFAADPDLPDQGHQRFGRVAADLGLRAGYSPLRFFGVEAEGGFMPTRSESDARATLWSVRAHAVGQLGLWSVTPFVVFGAGAFGVGSGGAGGVGTDVDASLHFGAGVKVFINRWVALRLDVRDVISSKQGVDRGVANTAELLLGISGTLGRKRSEAPAPVAKPKRRDADGDGILDGKDACPNEAGVPPDGCPVRDQDGDGVLDDVDECPKEPGEPPSGCPNLDPDGDGIVGDADACPTDAETVNEFEDSDGCPDEVPEEVQKFNGTIEGIYFELNSSTIRADSKPRMDQAVETFKKYPQLRVEISGHSDSTGSRELNMELSRSRAEAVRDYLVQQGVEASRIETRGAGPDEPIDTNATAEGRSRNRRIEFRVLRQ